MSDQLLARPGSSDTFYSELDSIMSRKAAPEPPPKRGIAEDIATHLAVGANKYLALPVAGITEMAGKATGIKSVENAGKTFGDNAESWIAQKEQEDPSQKFRDISSVGDAARWAGEQMLEFAPQAVIGLATGGAGAAAGRVAAGGLARAGITSIEGMAGKKAVQAAVANTGRSLTTKELGILAADRAGTAGAIAATGAGSVAMESSTIYRDQKPEEKDMGRALLFGTAAGILDTAFPAYLMKKTGLTKIMPGMGKVSGEAEALTGKTALTGVQRVKDTAKVAGLGIGEETAQEGVQTVLENIGSNKQVYSDEVIKAGGNFSAFLKVASDKGISAAVHPDAWNDIIESMAAGGLIGGVMGGGSSAVGHVSDVMQQRGQQTPAEVVNASSNQSQPNTENVTATNARTGNLLQDTSNAGSDSIPESWPVDSGRDLGIAATPPAGAMTRAVNSILPDLPPISADMYSSFAAQPFANAPEAQPDTAALPSPPNELERALTWRKQQSSGHLMQLHGERDASYTSRVLSEYRKSQGEANGITNILPEVQREGTLQVDRSQVALPVVQGGVAGDGSNNIQSGGVSNDLSSVQQKINGTQEEVSGVRNQAVTDRVTALKQEKEQILANSSKGITGGLVYPTAVTQRLGEINAEIQHVENGGTNANQLSAATNGIPVDSGRDASIEHSGYANKPSEPGMAEGNVATGDLPAVSGGDVRSDDGQLSQGMRKSNRAKNFKRSSYADKNRGVGQDNGNARRNSRSLLTDVKRLGGIKLQLIVDFLGKKEVRGKDERGNRYIRVTNSTGSDMATMAKEMLSAGWQIPRDLNGEADAQAFADILREEINGSKATHPEDENTIAENSYNQELQRLEEQYAELSPEDISDAVTAVDEEADTFTDITEEQANEALSLFDSIFGTSEEQTTETETAGVSPVDAQPVQAEATGESTKIDRLKPSRQKHLAKLKADMLAAKEPKVRKSLQDRIAKMKERTGVTDELPTPPKTIEDEINSLSLEEMAAMFDDVTAAEKPVRSLSKAKKHEAYLKQVIAKAKPENKPRIQKALQKHKAKQEERKSTPPPVGTHPVKPERDTATTPYFKEGDRVQADNGRHGEITYAGTSVGTLFSFGDDHGAKSYMHSYTVKWDNGVNGFGSFSDMNHETDPAPDVVPAPLYNGANVEPDQLLRNVEYSRKQAQSSRNAAERAKKKENIASHEKSASAFDKTADEQQAAFDTWAEKYPDEADKYRQKAEAAKPKVEPVAGMKVSFNSAQNGIELRFEGKPSDAVISKIKAEGFRWAMRKRVWYVTDTPARRKFVEGLQGDAVTPAKVELADNEVQVDSNPYIYTKVDGDWYYRSVGGTAPGNKFSPPFDFLDKLNTALAGKSFVDVVAESIPAKSVDNSPYEKEKRGKAIDAAWSMATKFINNGQGTDEYYNVFKKDLEVYVWDYYALSPEDLESAIKEIGGYAGLFDLWSKQTARSAKPAINSDADFSAKWDTMGYGPREKLAEASSYGSMRKVVHRISGSKWSELSPGEQASMLKAATTPDTRGASDILKAAADSGVKGAGEALKGLYDIFGGGSLKNFPGAVDEHTYAKAKPHFVAAYNNFKESGKQLTEFFQFIAKQFGNAIKPYLMRFMDDVKNNNYAIIEENEEVSDVNSERQKTGTDDSIVDEGTGTSDVQGSDKSGDVADVPGRVRSGDGSIVSDSIRASVNEDQQDSRLNGADAAERTSTTRDMGSDPSGLSGVLRPDATGDLRIPNGGLDRTGRWKDSASRNLDIVELIKTLREEKRNATPDEQLLLMKYVGWGSGEIRNKIFPGYAEQGRIIPQWAEASWKPLVDRLDTALTPEELKTAARSSQYAHYTSEAITRSMWKAFERMGFAGGKVFEPGPGTGNFMGTMPDGIYANSKYTGIEMDGITAAIAQQLYPNQNIIHGDYTKQKFPGNFFDVAIGNPPFSSTTILTDPDYKKHKFSLHDFFFAKTIDKVRPGGLLAFVTSRYTMDKLDDKARAYLSERADLLGAIRLPQTAFKQHSGTEVVTDVIFLRKRADGEEAGGHAWGKTADIQIGDQTKQINEYFAAHPEMVLGTHVTERGQFSQNDYSVKPLEGDIEQLFAAAVQNLPANVYSAMRQDPKTIKQVVVERDFNPKNKKEGGVYLSDKGEIMRVENGSGVPLSSMVKLSAKEQVWLTDYIPLRDLMKQARFDQFNDAGWEKSLKELNKAYDVFVKKHGNIQAFTLSERVEKDEDGNEQRIEYRRWKWDTLVNRDVEGSLLWSLEQINDDGDISKASFLTGRTVMKPVRSTNPQSMGDALALSLDEIGMLDLDHIAGLMKMSRGEAIEALGDMIYETPSGEHLLADEYLSGDVVTKLAEAEQAARSDEKFQANVKALTEVQPKPLTPGQITAGLGMAWIPTDIVGEFAQEVLNLNIKVERHAATNTWKVTMGNAPAKGYGRRSSSKKQGVQSLRSSTAEWGTADRGANEILDAVLNQRPLRITVRDLDGKVSADPAATARVNEIADNMRTEFRSWIWTDAERAGEMLDLYNKKYNNLAPRRFDGSHLTLPGIATKYKLHPHQKRAIWRMIQTGNTYLAHAVGAGKTLEMIAAGMEMKRLGLINKPLYVVPNDQLSQWSAEFMDAYPLANIMVADELNFDLKNRKRFMAQAAMNAPDAIIITQSALGKLRMKPESVAPVKEKMLNAMREALSEAQDDDAPRHLISKMEKMIENAEQRFDSIVEDGKGDNIITYEELGVDFLFVDEAHKFRKLDFTTVQQVKGIDPVGSRTALDLFLKTNWMEHQKPGRSHVFASGTPVTNTMGELYNVMRFFMEEEMERDDIGHFDAWAAMFGQTAMDYELNAAGKYEPVSRFAKFNNLPELMKRVRTFMDVLTSSHLGAYVVRPDIKGGKPNMIIATPSDELKAYQTNVLQPRMQRARDWKPTPDQPGNPDPIINIITDGRLSSIDMRLVGSTKNDPDSKLNRVIDEIIRVYKDTKNVKYNGVDGKPSAIKGGTQVVFYNHGFGANVAKSRGFDARAWINQRLKAAGIPAGEVAWFDEYDTSAKQLSVMKDMREGRKKIIIGHANSLGVGKNLQTRLYALHYIDPPWYPSAVEQAHGRIIRQGNQNTEVEANWYSTKGSYDSTMWQMVGRKGRFIEQAFMGDDNLRTMEDVSEVSQYEMARALSSGDERVIKLVGLQADIERYSRLIEAHFQQQSQMRGDKNTAEWNISAYKKHIAKLKEAVKAVGGYVSGSSFKGIVGKRTIDKPGEFGEAVVAAYNQAVLELQNQFPDDSYKGVWTDSQQYGSINGMPLVASVAMSAVTTQYSNIVQITGDVPSEIDTNMMMYPQGTDGAGLARRIFNRLNDVSDSLRRTESNLAEDETKMKQLVKRIGAPFEHESAFNEKIAELSQLQAELTADEKQPAGTPTAANFKLSTASNTGIQSTEAQAWVSTLPISKRVNVVQSISDLPENAQAEITKAQVNPDHVQAMELHGTIHVITDNVPDMQRVKALVIGHELAHAGQSKKIVDIAVDWFRRTKDGKTDQAKEAQRILMQVSIRYGYNLDKADDYRRAVQEATAAIAEQVADGAMKPVGLIQRLFMYIKHWLRQNGLISHVSDSELSLAVAEMLRIGEKRLSVGMGGSEAQFAAAWHGSPHDHDRFDSTKIGTGEGNQAYGYGLYFAGAKSVAEYYRDKLSAYAGPNYFRNGIQLSQMDIRKEYFKVGRIVDGYGGKDKVLDFQERNDVWGWQVKVQAVNSEGNPVSGERPRWHSTDPDGTKVEKVLRADGVNVRKSGKLYQVELAPQEDEYLLWDMPLSEQSEKVKKILDSAYKEAQREQVDYSKRFPEANLSDYEYMMWNEKVAMLSIMYDAVNGDTYRTGSDMYHAFSRIELGDQPASEILQYLGIRGIKYLDGSSRSAGEGNYNYVIFNDADVSIQAKFALSPAVTSVVNRAKETFGENFTEGIGKGIGQILNPLDFSRSRKWFESVAPDSVKNAMGWLFANPVYQAERDANKQPFVDAGIAREEDKIGFQLAFMGWDGTTKDSSLWSRIKDTYGNWQNPDKATAWGRIQAANAALSGVEQRAISTFLVEGDRQSRVYAGLDKAMTNPRIAAAKPTEAAFKVYKDVRNHIDQVVANERERIFTEMTRKAGVDEDTIKRHINDYRQSLSERPGWLPRNHGEGKHQVNVYHIVDGLKFEVKSVKTDGHGDNSSQAYLPYYAGPQATDMLTTTVKGINEKYDAADRDKRLKFGAYINGKALTANGQLIVTGSKEDVAEFLKLAKGVVPAVIEKNKQRLVELQAERIHKEEEGASRAELRELDAQIKSATDTRIRVKVFMQLHESQNRAEKALASVRKDMKAAMPINFRKDDTYESDYRIADGMTESAYGDLAGDFAMERAQLEALKRATQSGEISKEEAAKLRNNIIKSTAEVLMGRGAGRHQIERAPYMIEGYETENAPQLYDDYMTATAGMLSKALYAREQFENFRYSPPEVKVWAEQYIKDTLRNMGLADRISGNARSIATFMYLGGKISSILVNGTQVWTLGVAELGRRSKQNSMAAIGKAQLDIMKGKLSADEKELFNSKIWKLQEMETAVNEMAGAHEGTTGKISQHFHTLINKAMMPFQEMELTNRRTMILAAYRSGLADGMSKSDAIDFALDVNRKTNFEMSRANLPGWARNPLGRTAYALQSFVWNNWNWVYNRATSGQKADMIALLKYSAMIAAVGGAAAMAGGDEADKLYRRIYGRSIKMDLQQWTRAHLKDFGFAGDRLNAFIWHGAAGVAGINISNSMRLNIPMSGFVTGESSAGEAAMGVWSGMLDKGMKTGENLAKGKLGRAVESAVPDALAAPLKAYRMATEGATTSHGKPVFDENGRPVKYSTGEAVTRSFGFQPLEQSQRAETANSLQKINKNWNEQRQEVLDGLRSGTANSRDVQKFNIELRKSQAFPKVGIITAATVASSRIVKPDKKTMLQQRMVQ